MKNYRIKKNDIGMCMSVGCDFYQTCTNNSVNMFYRPKYKLEPIIEDDICLSYGSGKNTRDFKENCYPNVLKKVIKNH